MAARKAQTWVVAIYLMFAALTWIGFTHAPRDGLSNLFLAIVVLPYTLVGFLITWMTGASELVLIPSKVGYLTANAVFFVPGVALCSILLWWITGRLYR